MVVLPTSRRLDAGRRRAATPPQGASEGPLRQGSQKLGTTHEVAMSGSEGLGLPEPRQENTSESQRETGTHMVNEHM